MSRRSGTAKTAGEASDARDEDIVDAVRGAEGMAGSEGATTTTCAPEPAAGVLTAEALERFLAAAEADREAAAEREAQILARFTKLTVAMVCLTLVVAAANVTMILRQPRAAQPSMVEAPRPAEPVAATTLPVSPVPPPPVSAKPTSEEPAQAPTRIPLLGRPLKAWSEPAPARFARATIKPNRPQPMLAGGNEESVPERISHVERW